MTGGRIHLRQRLAVGLRSHGPFRPEQLVTTDENRWSEAGEPTLYLASDPGVALAELARHVEPDASAIEASVWVVDADVDDVIDARELVSAEVMLDRARCRSLAVRARRDDVAGLIVPSFPFLDQHDRFNVILFAERLRRLDGHFGRASAVSIGSTLRLP